MGTLLNQNANFVMRQIPTWVPSGARNYLAHTEAGCGIRALARANDLHASTVLRQVRRLESRRDDPLVDRALRDLASSVSASVSRQTGEAAMTIEHQHETEAELARKATPVLRSLSASGAVMAVADGMDMAVVVRETAAGHTQRTANVPLELAQAMALKDWILCDEGTGKILRYRITAQGRAQLRDSMAAEENSALGFAEGQARFLGAEATAPRRTAPSDSPLGVLARRRDKEGTAFLSRAQVQAGERLREDFELARMAPKAVQNWEEVLHHGRAQDPGAGVHSARDRVADALADLGPGLGDIALRCCCYGDGMEQTEQQMGWSARSGKIVLRIALERLQRHYAGLGGQGDMIG